MKYLDLTRFNIYIIISRFYIRLMRVSSEYQTFLHISPVPSLTHSAFAVAAAASRRRAAHHAAGSRRLSSDADTLSLSHAAAAARLRARLAALRLEHAALLGAAATAARAVAASGDVRMR